MIHVFIKQSNIIGVQFSTLLFHSRFYYKHRIRCRTIAQREVWVARVPFIPKRLASKVICLKNILVLTFFREYIPKLASWVQNHAQLFVRNKTFFYGWNCSFNPELFFIFNFFGMYFLSCARHCVCLMFFFITITMFKFICESIIVKAVVHNISFHCFIMYLGFIGIRLLLLA